jgi:type III secretion protein S
MSELSYVREGFMLALAVSLPVLFTCLAAGTVTSLLQAITQVQDQAVSFVVKLLAVSVLLSIYGPQCLREIVAFTGGLFAVAGRR